MSHRPVVIHDLNLTFPHKTCFEGFSVTIHPGDRIAIIGQNGSGKSHLVRMLIEAAPFASVGHVPQIIHHHEVLSGGERFNKTLSNELAKEPDLLCLDEPTNHLDAHNKQALMRMLDRYQGTLIVVTHDVELLRRKFDALWHIREGRVHIARGGYEEYLERQRCLRESLEGKLSALKSERKQNHQDLMRDQERAKKKKAHGEKKYDGDKLALRSAQGRGQLTTNKNRKRIGSEKNEILTELWEIRMPDVMRPTFTLSAADIHSNMPIVQIRHGACGYEHMLLTDLHVQLNASERLVLKGPNGCGKTTLLRAILGDKDVKREGAWQTPHAADIGYLHQHYGTLDPELSALDIIREAAPHLTNVDIREHLNRYLLRKNEEVNVKSKFLSGGEKARLSLAKIGARTPKLLILDELSNNLDLESREHVIQVLRVYPGAMIVVSHDADFVDQIGGCRSLDLKSW